MISSPVGTARAVQGLLLSAALLYVTADITVLAGCDQVGRPSAPGVSIVPSGQPGPPPIAGEKPEQPAGDG